VSTTVLITCASRGLGLELAKQYAAAGAGVIACCREPEKATELQELAKRSADGRVTVLELDVTDLDHIHRLADDLAGQPIDILINNAGIYPRKGERFGSVDGEAWMRTFRTNTIAPLRMCEALIEHVASSARKTIVNITSLMGSIGDNSSGGSYAYRSSKAALNMVTVSMARDLAPRGVTCLCIHPGWVKTDMGGGEAPIEIPDSVKGMKKVIDGATIAQSGKFFDYEGDELPW
jgi:NAD(P)-dependent dehydrogenase (short-subunit alcohol dehydrogenase family)